MAKRISVVISQGQSNSPAKRGLEEDLVAALMMEPGVDVTVIPNLYDLQPDGTGMLALQGISGNMVVLSWLYERAAFWTLDRHGILGRQGESLLKNEADEDDDEAADDAEEDTKERVRDSREVPNRSIYCIDLRAADSAEAFVEEVKRILAENATQVVGLTDWLGGSGTDAQMNRFLHPTNTTALGGNGQGGNGHGGNGHAGNGQGGNGQGREAVPATGQPAGAAPGDGASSGPRRVEEDAGRRWYPVIDFSRCTNCMECIDFCLFGVYGVDAAETILVEQPDNCRKGCPACSRVCPENAIIFPQHKTPMIAGAPGVSGGLKIDLSQLFGAPDAVEVAAKERDEQLLLAGRDAVGMSVGIPKRQEGKSEAPKDDLDDLIDGLDDLDL